MTALAVTHTKDVSETLNGALPPSYVSLLAAESAEGFDLAIDGLRTAVALGDLHRGAKFHAAALQRHINLRHKLSDEQKLELIGLFFQLVVQDAPLPLRVRMRWCGLLERLLRRAKHLELSLPFRPLFDLLLRRSYPRLRPHEFVNRSVEHHYVQALARVASRCARHFPAGASAEILEAVEPLLCAQDAQLFVGAALLSLLLPTHGAEAAVWMPRLLDLWQVWRVRRRRPRPEAPITQAGAPLLLARPQAGALPPTSKPSAHAGFRSSLATASALPLL
eukprot:2502894-Prymnesium_polylepis.1